MKKLNAILAGSHIAFGTSGARGVVTDFNDKVCAAFTQSFILSLMPAFNFGRVAIGIDNRPSSPAMAAACIGMVQALGLQADYYGVLPTPALAYQAMQDGIPAIMITGSHIPFDRNGIKFYRPDGEISKADEQLIINAEANLLPFTPSLPSVNPHASNQYMQRYLAVFPNNALAGKHIGIYEHSSAGRELYYQVFAALGAKVTRLEPSDTFVPIDTEAVSDADMAKGKAWAAAHGFDALFSSDGDGDRPLIADETGTWLRGDIVGLLTATALNIEALAVPVSCNTAIEQSGIFKQVLRTKIGSPYVIAAFAELQHHPSYAGFEANGGFLLGSDVRLGDAHLKALPTRDALLPALALLVLAGNQPVSALLSALPERFTASDRLQQVPTVWSQAFIADAAKAPDNLLAQFGLSAKVDKVDQTDGLRLTLSTGDIIHLRPSGNAPELRCYVESISDVQAGSLLALALNAIKKLIFAC